MARKSETSEPIGGYRYKVRQLGTNDGLEVLTQIAKLVLPGAGAVAGGGSIQELLNANVGGDQFAEVASRLASSLDSKTVKQIIAKLAESTDVFGPGFGDSGAPLDIHFDDHFAGEYGNLIKWAQFALKVNFGSFWGGLVPGGEGGSESQAPPKPQ